MAIGEFIYKGFIRFISEELFQNKLWLKTSYIKPMSTARDG